MLKIIQQTTRLLAHYNKRTGCRPSVFQPVKAGKHLARTYADDILVGKVLVDLEHAKSEARGSICDGVRTRTKPLVVHKCATARMGERSNNSLSEPSLCVPIS